MLFAHGYSAITLQIALVYMNGYKNRSKRDMYLQKLYPNFIDGTWGLVHRDVCL